MTTNSRKVVHDIPCAFYKISFKNEKIPNQPRGKFSHFLSVEQVFDFIKKHNKRFRNSYLTSYNILFIKHVI